MSLGFLLGIKFIEEGVNEFEEDEEKGFPSFKHNGGGNADNARECGNEEENNEEDGGALKETTSTEEEDNEMEGKACNGAA